MRHARFDVAFLSVEGVDLPLKAASLVVAESDDAEHPHWECLAYAVDAAPIAPGTYRLEVHLFPDRTVSGEAVRVRSVDGAHVFRGIGPLAGISAGDLHEAPGGQTGRRPNA